MESTTTNNKTLELGNNLNQGTLSRYSVMYLLPFFFIPPITGEAPLLFDYDEGQLISESGNVIEKPASKLSEHINDPIQIGLYDRSQSTFDIEMRSISDNLEDYSLLESFIIDLLDNSENLPGELNKLIYENIDDLLI